MNLHISKISGTFAAELDGINLWGEVEKRLKI